MENLGGYLERVGLGGDAADGGGFPLDAATLARIMEAHSRSIPFENCSVVMKQTIDMSAAAVERKLVRERRGGYCWEQNELLMIALRAMGFEVRPLMCRVRWGKVSDENGTKPNTTFTHMALKVTLPEGEELLADVGFAGTNSIVPLALRSREPQVCPEGRFRIVDVPQVGFMELQLEVKGEWRALYTWRDEEAAAIDMECSNWFSCTYPSARFTNEFFVCRPVGDERHHIRNAEYVVRRGHGIDSELKTLRIRDRAHLTELLEGVFGLEISSKEEGFDLLDRFL